MIEFEIIIFKFDFLDIIFQIRNQNDFDSIEYKIRYSSDNLSKILKKKKQLSWYKWIIYLIWKLNLKIVNIKRNAISVSSDSEELKQKNKMTYIKIR